ncbi:MAG TPA: hypothetical protein VJ967_09160, partial [Clostridia bacterium]|nr:hypothetical protein [Clostridia bacterium]
MENNLRVWTFRDSLTAYGREDKIDTQLLDSITTKTKMGLTEKLVPKCPLSGVGAGTNRYKVPPMLQQSII